jgi:peptidoglycan hydrolase CwlO-like protein
MNDRQSQRKIKKLQNKIADLNALIDTLQTVLKRAETVINNKEDYDYVFTQSARWSMKAKITGE